MGSVYRSYGLDKLDLLLVGSGWVPNGFEWVPNGFDWVQNHLVIGLPGRALLFVLSHLLGSNAHFLVFSPIRVRTVAGGPDADILSLFSVDMRLSRNAGEAAVGPHCPDYARIIHHAGIGLELSLLF
jgi:hypothetical protein